MNKTMMDILACPIDKTHPLELYEIKEKDDVISEGVIVCVSTGSSQGFDYMDAHIGVEGISGGPSGASGLSGFSGASFTTVPASDTSPGSSGQMAFDSTHLYIAVATNTWKRAIFEIGGF